MTAPEDGVFHPDHPPLAELVRQFKGSSPVFNGWHRLKHNEEIRFARWSPQWGDNRRYDTNSGAAKPWNGASDVRVFLTDDTVNELKAVLVNAFWRSVELVEGVGHEDNERAAHVKNLFRWIMGTKQKRELAAEVELSADYLLTYGLCVLHPHWHREVDMELRRFKLEELAALGERMPEVAALVAAVLDPSREEEAVGLAEDLAGRLVAGHFQSQLGDERNEALEGYAITRARARKLVRALRTEGMGELPVPWFCVNGPAIACLKPWEEVFLPGGMTDIQHGPVFHAQWLTEGQLRARAVVEGWPEEFVGAAVAKKGRFSTWSEDGFRTSDPDVQWSHTFTEDEAADRIEIIHASYWMLDSAGDARWRVRTTFHPEITDTWAAHEPLNLPHKRFPYVLGMLERTDRRIDASRSLPERLASRQREVKVQRDALIDLTSLSVVPPVVQYDTGMDVEFQYGPLARNTCTPGREPQFMEIKGPGTPVAFNLWEKVEAEVDNAVGRLSEKVPPARAQAKMQMLINNFLLMWTEAFQQQFALMCEYMPDGEYQRVTGDPQPLPKGAEAARQFDLILSFDARELDMEHVKAQFEAITKGLLPFDKTNTINTGKFIAAGLRAINPNLGREIMATPQEGLAARKAAVEGNLIKMFNGFEPDYLEDANPAAQMDLQILEALLRQNRKYQQALQQDVDFAERVTKYQESLMFNVQQAENKQVGRVGVK